MPRAEHWGDIRQSSTRAALWLQEGLCIHTAHRWAKHTQHLLVLCLDPVSTVSLSLKKKTTKHQQIEFSPIQTSLLPPLSSFMAQALGQLPGCQVPPAHSNMSRMIAGPAVRNHGTTQNNCGKEQARGKTSNCSKPLTLLPLCLPVVVSLLQPSLSHQASPGQNDSSLGIFK